MSISLMMTQSFLQSQSSAMSQHNQRIWYFLRQDTRILRTEMIGGKEVERAIVQITSTSPEKGVEGQKEEQKRKMKTLNVNYKSSYVTRLPVSATPRSLFLSRSHAFTISLPVSATPRSLFLSRSHTFTSVLWSNPAPGIMRWYVLNPQDLLPGCTIPRHQDESATRFENPQSISPQRILQEFSQANSCSQREEP